MIKELLIFKDHFFDIKEEKYNLINFEKRFIFNTNISDPLLRSARDEILKIC